ncbi:hypothetical protein SAMN04488121_103211 [Chitinophaga filiformis]|uniref:Uncharacterized protein n=1 Tax=Chitinophaga filiformis TaxID=104663 RepID=A0A1G7QVM0_CHIFI|nr:hypothetical protein SAMN04488121_103211 [Chitinophaga filiformis]
MHEHNAGFGQAINTGCLNFANDGLMFVIAMMWLLPNFGYYLT